MTRLVTLCTIFGAVFCAQAQAAAELDQREAVYAAVRGLFAEEDFLTLEELSASYRDTGSRTSSGVWHLSLFYKGLDIAIGDDEQSSPRDVRFESAERKVQRWSEEFPDSPSAHIAYGMLLVARAWSHRGSQNGRDVSPDAWDPFYRNLTLAREYLEQHKSIAAADPQWYKVMLWIAKGEGWNFVEFGGLLDEALDREPLFYETWFSALDYLLPKWHGNAVAIEAFARETARRTAAYESGTYARIYWYASQAQYGNDLFAASHVDWPLMREGFEDVIADYPDAWNVNNFARFSCLARDRDKTNELFERIRDDVVPEAWQPWSVYTECSFWLLLR